MNLNNDPAIKVADVGVPNWSLTTDKDSLLLAAFRIFFGKLVPMLSRPKPVEKLNNFQNFQQ